MRKRFSSPTRRIAAGMLVVAALGLIAFFALGWAQAWMPNVVVGALTVALTVTVVEDALQRAADLRLEPRRKSVMGWVALSVGMTLRAIATDYAQHHLDNFRAIPADGLALIAQWNADLTKEDNQPTRGPRVDLNGRAVGPTPKTPMLYDEAVELLNILERHRDRDREVMPDGLVEAIDSFGWWIGQARLSIDFGLAGLDVGEGDNDDRESRTCVVSGVGLIAEAVARDRPAVLEIPALTREAAASHSARLRELRDAKSNRFSAADDA